MDKDIKLLKKEFLRIKHMGFVKSLRQGSTSIGYTFETLLQKKEDQECKPDFKSVEIKCKLGYTKSPLSLFTCAPKRNNQPAMEYIFNNYANNRYNNLMAPKIFSLKIYSNQTYNWYGFTFHLKVDYLNKQVLLQSFVNNTFLEDVATWDFKSLETKLKVKLKTLAIVYGYPYILKKELYYKFTNIKFFKLRGFFEFLKLIETDKIFIQIYLKEKVNNDGKTVIENHGVAFKIPLEYVNYLFYSIR